jgi:protein-disulfide isomerase
MMQGPFHNYACQAAYYARCAAKQDKYWPFEAKLFENRERLTSKDLRGYAEEVGLDVAKLVKCAKSASTRQAVIEDIRRGLKREMKGTPTFFVNGEMIVGVRRVEFWEAKIAALLKGK